jgi:hypothetical protein
MMERDIRDQKGNLIAAAGQRINPLDFVSVRQDLVFIDGDDPAQTAWAIEHYSDIKAKIILVNGSPVELMTAKKRRFYFDQAGKLTDPVRHRAHTGNRHPGRQGDARVQSRSSPEKQADATLARHASHADGGPRDRRAATSAPDLADALSDARRRDYWPAAAIARLRAGGAMRDRSTSACQYLHDRRLPRAEASRRHLLSGSKRGGAMMHSARWALRLLLTLIAAFILAPSAQAAGPTCHGKFVNPITDVCWSCLFPLSVGGLKIWPSGRPDTAIRLRRSAPAAPLPRIGISVGFWEPARLADVTMKPWCFPNLGGIRIAPGFDIGQGYLAGPSMVGGRSQSTAKWHVHWYVYPLLYWMEILTDFVCFEQASFDIAYMTEIDPLWQDDSLTALINPEAIVFANPIAQAACAGDCIAGTAPAARSALLVRGLPGQHVSAQRQRPVLDRPCSVVAARAVPLRLQDAPRGAGLGNDGLGGPLQEVPHADHAEAAIPLPDGQSDPDGERAVRLLRDRGIHHAARCRPRLSRRRRGHGLPRLAQAQLLRSLGGHAMRGYLWALLFSASPAYRRCSRRPSTGSTFRRSRSARPTSGDAEAFVNQVKDAVMFREEAACE